MNLAAWLGQYVVAVVVFCVVDVLWLGNVAKGLYAERLGDLLAPKPNVPAAVVFYAIFVAGLVYFVIHPAVTEQSLVRAVLAGAFFGFVTYATWDLTNLAVIRDFPASLVVIDMAWGTVLAAVVSTVTYLAAGALDILR